MCDCGESVICTIYLPSFAILEEVDAATITVFLSQQLGLLLSQLRDAGLQG